MEAPHLLFNITVKVLRCESSLPSQAMETIRLSFVGSHYLHLTICLYWHALKLNNVNNKVISPTVFLKAGYFALQSNVCVLVLATVK